MRDNFKFGVPKSYTIDNEVINGILLDVNALTSSDAIANIADLNKVRLDLSYKIAGVEQPLVIFKGFLGDLLNVMYQQSTMLTLVTKKLASGYKIYLDFSQFPIFAKFGSELTLETEFPTSAFTSSVLSKSTVDIETIVSDSTTNAGVLNVYDNFVPEVGRSSYEKNIGSNIQAIHLTTDTVGYDASSKAKPVDTDIISQGFNKNLSENALIYLNAQMLHYSDEDFKNLWLYNSNERLLNDVTLRLKFNKVTDATSLIQVKRLVKLS